jgi:hypothetical protein
MAYNVSAVLRHFFAPDKENAEYFYWRKKMWRRKTAQRTLAMYGAPDCGFS